MECNHTSSLVCEKLKFQPFAGKVLLTIFWDSQRSMVSQHYFEELEDKVRPAIKRERGRLLLEGVILQHDSTSLHTVQLTRDKLQELGWGYNLISRTVQILPRLIYTCLDHSKTSQQRINSLPNELGSHKKDWTDAWMLGVSILKIKRKFCKNLMNYFWAIAICLFSY